MLLVMSQKLKGATCIWFSLEAISTGVFWWVLWPNACNRTWCTIQCTLTENYLGKDMHLGGRSSPKTKMAWNNHWQPNHSAIGRMQEPEYPSCSSCGYSYCNIVQWSTGMQISPCMCSSTTFLFASNHLIISSWGKKFWITSGTTIILSVL